MVLYLIVIMCMRIIQSVFNKRASMILPDSISVYVKYMMLLNIMAACFSALTLLLAHDFSKINLQTVWMACGSGICLVLNSYCGIKALTGGTIVLGSVFSTAGILLPCLLGIFLFDEPMSVWQWACVAGLIVSAVLLIDSSKKTYAGFSPKTLVYLLGSFFTNGMVMFFQKLFGILQPDGSVSLFSFLTFLLPSIALFVFSLFLKTEKTEIAGQKEHFPKVLFGYALLLAFAVFVIQQLVTLLTPRLSSVLLFGLVNGGATVIAVLVGAVLYHEKLTIKSILGVILGVFALICLKAFS